VEIDVSLRLAFLLFDRHPASESIQVPLPRQVMHALIEIRTAPGSG